MSRQVVPEAVLHELKTCAFCPAPCRRAYPPDLEHQTESRIPSALALLALHVHQGVLAYDHEVDAVLGELRAAELCSAVCVYGYDVPGVIRALRTSWEPASTAE